MNEISVIIRFAHWPWNGWSLQFRPFFGPTHTLNWGYGKGMRKLYYKKR